MAKEQTIRASSTSENDFQLKSEISRLKEENSRIKEELVHSSEELFNVQACMAVSENEAKHTFDKRIKSLESALAFKEQEAKALLQQHTHLLENEKKRKFTDVSGNTESKVNTEKAALLDRRSVGTTTEQLDTWTCTASSMQLQQPSSSDTQHLELVKIILIDFHAILAKVVSLPSQETTASSVKSSSTHARLKAHLLQSLPEAVEALSAAVQGAVVSMALHHGADLLPLLPPLLSFIRLILQLNSNDDKHFSNVATPGPNRAAACLPLHAMGPHIAVDESLVVSSLSLLLHAVSSLSGSSPPLSTPESLAAPTTAADLSVKTISNRLFPDSAVKVARLGDGTDNGSINSCTIAIASGLSLDGAVLADAVGVMHDVLRAAAPNSQVVPRLVYSSPQMKVTMSTC
jgi:hypothetical protein